MFPIFTIIGICTGNYGLILLDFVGVFLLVVAALICGANKAAEKVLK